MPEQFLLNVNSLLLMEFVSINNRTFCFRHEHKNQKHPKYPIPVNIIIRWWRIEFENAFRVFMSTSPIYRRADPPKRFQFTKVYLLCHPWVMHPNQFFYSLTLYFFCVMHQSIPSYNREKQIRTTVRTDEKTTLNLDSRFPQKWLK